MQPPWHTSVESLDDFGFTGFRTIAELRATKLSAVPSGIGVYVIVRPVKSRPGFLKESTGGRFKGRDPNVSQEILQRHWVDDAQVVYIGKAGSANGSATLKSRLRQYLDFGAGRPIGHWGGRFIWHLHDSDELLVAWKETTDEEPRDVEKRLIREFVQSHGARPFANLVG